MAVLVAGLWPAFVHAEISFRATMSPNTVRYPETRRIVYQLQMTTGAREERFTVELDPPSFGAGLREEGATVFPLSVRLDGPGSMSIASREHATLACSFHGYEPQIESYRVAIPAQSSSTLTARFATGISPPWPSLDFRVRFRILPSYAPGDPGTLSRSQTVLPPAPRLRGKTGVQILFATKPRSSPLPVANVRRIRLGRPIAIRGRTEPSLRGQLIRLRFRGPNARRPRLLARVRVGRRGRFQFRSWRPARPGYYQLWAVYRPQRSRLVADRTCPRVFRVVPRGPAGKHR
jgi:hypothetical protein